MRIHKASIRSRQLAMLLGLVLTIAGCGSKEPPSAPAPATDEQPAAGQTTADATQTGTWTPEALEELLAPVALYPDPVLSQVLIASTNPQEVLDAGNWLLENQSLKGKALDDAAAAVGFTPPVRALVQFPDTLDMMCREMGWTTELGQAFVADQAGVLDAIQRLRKQAIDVGNLKSSPEMTVDNETEDGKDVVLLKPPASGEVAVPQYDPVAVYAPPPATPAPATTATTTTTSTGHSTGTLITTGLLAFGAGILVNELFHDDDDYKVKYYYPNYGYGGMPYYPPYPYRPVYGNGFYPGTGYRPPPGYGGGFYNSGNIIINNPGGGGGYWDRWDKGRAGYPRATPYRSPITAARPNRPELAELNKRQPRPMPADVKRPSVTAEPAQWKGRTTYAGAPGGAKPGRDTKMAANQPAKPMPKVQGSYKGASTPRAEVAPRTYQGADMGGNKAKGAPGGTAKPRSTANADRGFEEPRQKPADRAPQAQRPAAMPANRSGAQAGGGYKPPKNSAMSGAGGGGKAERAASQRGRESMPQGARTKGQGGRQQGGQNQKKR